MEWNGMEWKMEAGGRAGQGGAGRGTDRQRRGERERREERGEEREKPKAKRLKRLTSCKRPVNGNVYTDLHAFTSIYRNVYMHLQAPVNTGKRPVNASCKHM
jgi:hypothetical protein